MNKEMIIRKDVTVISTALRPIRQAQGPRVLPQGPREMVTTKRMVTMIIRKITVNRILTLQSWLDFLTKSA